MGLNWVGLAKRAATIVPQIIGMIRSVEANRDDIGGPQKKEIVMEWSRKSIPIAEGAVGKDLVDDALVLDAMSKLVDAYVAFENAHAAFEAAMADAKSRNANTPDGV